MPRCDPMTYVPLLNEVMTACDIITNRRMAFFLAHLAHESRDLTVLVENLNYSASGLVATWPTRFGPPPKLDPLLYARQPEQIANAVYGGRMGNSEPGDGWKFRGRGGIMITGRANYAQFGKDRGMPEVMEQPDRVALPMGAVECAGWFWTTRQLNELADANDFVGSTKRVNGGTVGLEDRIKRKDRALQVFEGRLTQGAQS